jgi:uncharacterized protein YkwD
MVNLFDAILALIVLLSAWAGWRKGFVAATLLLLTLVISVLVAFVGYRYPAAWLEDHAPTLGVWTSPISFLATYVFAHAVFGAVARQLVNAMPGHLHVHGANRALGVLPGLANGLINATIASLILLTVPVFDDASRMVRESALVGRLSAPAEWLESSLAPIFDPAIRRTLQAITVPPESRASIDLQFTVDNPQVRPDLEVLMLEMVNTERTSRGLKPLKPDTDLAEVARAHSRDMFARGYFSHVTPDGKELSHRIRRAKLGYLMAGENLALAPTLAGAHQGLMNSPGHRANILRPQFARLGVGVMDGGRHGLIITQNFRN